MPQTIALRAFVDDVARIVATTREERPVVDAVADRLQRLLDDGFTVDARYSAPHPEHYVMYPLYVAPDGAFSVACAVWGVGQRTPLHDHRVWGVVGIVDGVEHEERFAPPDGPAAPARPLGTLDLGPGQVTVCCTTDQDVHRVSCGSPVPCVGIHVYGGNIWATSRRAYDEKSGEVSWFTSTMPDVPPALAPDGQDGK